MSKDHQLTLNEVGESNSGPKAAHIENSAFGDIPGDWNWKESQEHLEYIESGISESQNKDEEGVPVSRIETIANGTVNYQKVGYVSGDNDYSKHRLKAGDLLFSNINSREEIGKTAIYEGEQPLYHGINLLRLRYDSDEFNPYFAYYLYDSPMAQDVFFRMSKAAVGQSSINQSQMERLFLPTPPLPEQRKIATVLYTIDRAIEKTEEIITHVEKLRKSVIDEIFTSGCREHSQQQSEYIGPRKVEYPADWGSFELEEITSKVTKGKTPTSYGYDYLDSGINFIKVESILEYGGFDKTMFDYIGSDAHQHLSGSELQEDDVLFSIAGALGKVAIVTKSQLPANTNQALALIRVDDSRALPEYIRYYLETAIIRKENSKFRNLL